MSKLFTKRWVVMKTLNRVTTIGLIVIVLILSIKPTKVRGVEVDAPSFQCPGAQFVFPSGNYISATYRYCRGSDQCGNYHQGIDTKQFENGVQVTTPGIVPVYAAYAGVVILGPGPVSQGLDIKHTNVGGQAVVYTYYAHMANSDRTKSYIVVNNGQWVEQGQLIGYQGNYGASSVHLHFSVNYPGMNEYDNNQDPSSFLGLNVNGNNGAQAGYVTAEKCYSQPVEMFIDTPTQNQSLRGEAVVGGWAIHRSASSGTGIDAVHIYLDGTAGVGQGIGVATYGIERPDVAAVYGERFRYSGYHFNWDLKNVHQGSHRLFVYVHSVVTGWSYYTRDIYIIPFVNVYIPVVIKNQGPGFQELAYDDGSGEFGFLASPNVIGAVKYHTSSRAQVVKLRFFVSGGNESVRVHVLNANQLSIFSKTVNFSPSSGSWAEVDMLNNYVFVYGDFYIGLQWIYQSPNNPWLFVDTQAPYNKRSYLGVEGSLYHKGSGNENEQKEDYLIRVVLLK